MSLGIFVMLIIIGITIAVMLAVMYYGLKHDPHMDIRSAESSKSVDLLNEQNKKRLQKLQAMQTQQQLATETAGDAPKSAGTSALGGDDERAARKAAALARKAAKQNAVDS